MTSLTTSIGTALSCAPLKPLLLWAKVYCLLDTSSVAAFEVREMLRQLVAHGYPVGVLGATVFDHERGTLRLQSKWDAVQALSHIHI